MTTLAVAPELASSIARQRTSASSAALAAADAGNVASRVNRWATKLLMATTRPCGPRVRSGNAALTNSWNDVAMIAKDRSSPARGNCAKPRRSGIGQVAGGPRDPGAGALTVRGHCFQSLGPCRVGPLSMQHQALVPGRQPARDRGSDPDSASGDD